MQHPDERARLASEASLMPTAIEEMLRYTSSVTVFVRTAAKDTELRGIPVKAGARAAMFYPSANRDESRFADPDRFDIGRAPNPHLAFGGGGTHFCLGANLARVEASAIIPEVLSRMNDLELAGPAERVRSNLINGIRSMPVWGDDTGNPRPAHPRLIAAFLSCSATSPSSRHGNGKYLPSPVAKLGASQRVWNAAGLSTMCVLGGRLPGRQRLWLAGRGPRTRAGPTARP
jgi:hypothetical protein